MDKLVSIITPVYNREEFISGMIESVLAQTYANWELLLVDDGSTDKSWEIMQSYAVRDNRIKVSKRPMKRLKGGNAARNFGFENAKGSFINWFDSDDKMLPDFIAEKVKTFERNRGIDLVLSKTIRVFPNGERVFEKRTRMTESLFEDYITTNISWYLPDGMFRREFLDSGYLFNESVRAGQDRDFYIRNIFKCRVKVIDKYLTEYVFHNSSISHSLYRSNSYEIQLSVFTNLIGQIKYLKENNLLSERLKNYYFVEIKNKLPAVMKCGSMRSTYFLSLYGLSSGNMYYIFTWIKILGAYLSFVVFGKGERLLKGKY